MKSLVQYIIESTQLRPVVIYGGKFQPFHKGHYEIYEKLVKEFGKDNVMKVNLVEYGTTRWEEK